MEEKFILPPIEAKFRKPFKSIILQIFISLVAILWTKNVHVQYKGYMEGNRIFAIIYMKFRMGVYMVVPQIFMYLILCFV